MLHLGCDRETASKYLGWTASHLRQELHRSSDFAIQVLRAEASAEFHQIHNVHEATKEAKNWRASVWWLERMAPERFAKRSTNVVTETEWQEFLEALAEAVVSEIADDADRNRLLNRLAQMADVSYTERKQETGSDSLDESPMLSFEEIANEDEQP